MPATGAEYIVRSLAERGITHVAGLCGHGNIGLLEALRTSPDVQTLSVHHEQAAGHIADAYYRVARKPMAIFTSCGPGSTNLPVALASAYYDRSALLAVTGNVPTTQFGKGAFQETFRPGQAAFGQVLRPYVKESYQPTTTDMLKRYTDNALDQLFSNPPAPVHLDVPLDLFPAQDERFDSMAHRPTMFGSVRPQPEALDAVLDAFSTATRPLIVVGPGFGVEDEQALFTLAERLGCHIATTPAAKGTLAETNPRVLGAVGRNGTAAANSASRRSDLVLALNVDFDDRSSSAWLNGATFSFDKGRLIHVHERPDMIGRAYRPTLAVVASPSGFVRALLDRLPTDLPGSPEWFAEVAAWRGISAEAADDPVPDEPGVMRPADIVQSLQQSLPDEAILLSDVGVHHNWLIQRWQTRKPGTFIHSWAFGSMGFGVAGVLGAKLAAPDVPAVTVCGDGGFVMNANAVATAVQANIPAIWVVWDNHGFVSIRDLQLAFFNGREFATSFVTKDDTDFVRFDHAALARSLGADGITVSDADDLREGIARALGSDGPTVLHVSVDRETRPMGTGGWELPPLDPAWPLVLL